MLAPLIRLSAALLVGLRLAVPGEAQFDADLGQRLQATLDATHGTRSGRGVGAAVHIPGAGVWTGASGSSHGSAPLRADMRFFIGSITKTITAAAIMQLIEEEKLTLNTTVKDALSGTLPADIDPDITIEQLLSHTSGIYNYTDAPNSYLRVFRDLEHQWTASELLEAFVGSARFDPGSRYHYSNTNFILLGMILEAVSGETAALAFERRLFGPLGLRSARLPSVDDLDRVQFAHGFSSITAVAPGRDFMNLSSLTSFMTFFHTAGGVYMTTEDLALWTHALFSGDIVKDIDEMMRMRFDSYGLGLMKTTVDGTELWGHGGLVFYHQAWTVHWPETGISVVVFTNDNADNAWAYLSPLLRVLKEKKIPQSLRNTLVGDRTLQDGTFALNVAAPVVSLPIHYELISGAAAIEGGTVTPKGPGQIEILATQVGNSYYLPTKELIEFDVFDISRLSSQNRNTQAYIEGARLRLALRHAEATKLISLEESSDLSTWKTVDTSAYFLSPNGIRIYSTDLAPEQRHSYFRITKLKE